MRSVHEPGNEMKRAMSDELVIDVAQTAFEPMIEVLPDFEAVDKMLAAPHTPTVALDLTSLAPGVRPVSQVEPRRLLTKVAMIVTTLLAQDEQTLRSLLAEPIPVNAPPAPIAPITPITPITPIAPSAQVDDADTVDDAVQRLLDRDLRAMCARIAALDRQMDATEAELCSRLACAWVTMATQFEEETNAFRRRYATLVDRIHHVAKQIRDSIDKRNLDDSLAKDVNRVQIHHRLLCQKLDEDEMDDRRLQVAHWLETRSEDTLVKQHAANCTSVNERTVRVKHARHAMCALVDDIEAKHMRLLRTTQPEVTRRDVDGLRSAHDEQEFVAADQLRALDDERNKLSHTVTDRQFSCLPPERAQLNRVLAACESARARRHHKLQQAMKDALARTRRVSLRYLSRLSASMVGAESAPPPTEPGGVTLSPHRPDDRLFDTSSSSAIGLDAGTSLSGASERDARQSPSGAIGLDARASPSGAIGLDASDSSSGAIGLDALASPSGAIGLDALASPSGAIGLAAGHSPSSAVGCSARASPSRAIELDTRSA